MAFATRNILRLTDLENGPQLLDMKKQVTTNTHSTVQ
jgi:hypothetical protein